MKSFYDFIYIANIDAEMLLCIHVNQLSLLLKILSFVPIIPYCILISFGYSQQNSSPLKEIPLLETNKNIEKRNTFWLH